MKLKRIVVIICSCLLLFLIFTNPSIEDFKRDFPHYIAPASADSDFNHGKYIDPHYIVRRDRNYFLFSHFTWINIKVLGIAGNFFIVGSVPGSHQVIAKGGQVIFDGFVIDSTKNKDK